MNRIIKASYAKKDDRPKRKFTKADRRKVKSEITEIYIDEIKLKEELNEQKDY